MALKKDGERTRVTFTVKKTTQEKIARLALETNRAAGRMLDVIVEKYIENS